VVDQALEVLVAALRPRQQVVLALVVRVITVEATEDSLGEMILQAAVVVVMQ
jgi:hypothetical protein